MVGCQCIKTWSATQKNITLSSAEAEAVVRMGSELIGLLQLLNDWGIRKSARIYIYIYIYMSIRHRQLAPRSEDVTEICAM